MNNEGLVPPSCVVKITLSIFSTFFIDQVHEEGWRIFCVNQEITFVQIVDLQIQNGCKYSVY
ncbi:hypothetical protein CK203_059505 [Vitis vinifera]|uniref:Uncharacterized protein n=1 Tax=Vitis vinifera TaxID=29760 RepID=A0A438GJ22_VITVI|nr:hypothetical protein CK203_059505 [Vitis vinifera]